jgi:hypothetical protein
MFFVVEPKKEFIEIYQDQQKYIDKGTYSLNDWKGLNAKTQNKIKNLINKLTNESEIEILIYEWESGLSD